VYSKVVDYIVTDYYNIEKATADGKEFVQDSLKYIAKHGRPQLVLSGQIFQKDIFKNLSLFEDECKEEKLQRAINLYETCTSKIKAMIDKTGDYDIPICAQDAIISGVLCESAKLEDAFEFFDVISSRNHSWDGSHNETAQIYKRRYREAFVESGKSFRSSYCSLDGVRGYECPVALAVAGFVYGSPENSVDVEFTRDKWEWRGDYCSSFYIAFELSSSYPEGRVYRSLQHEYSNM
jgi:hypothetical protein